MVTPDRDPVGWFGAGMVRTRLLEALSQLPPDEHLAALEAVERHDVEIVLSDRTTVTIIVAERWQFTVPSRRQDPDD